MGKDGYHDPNEFVNCLQNMLPNHAGDFDVADVDSDGGISFDEFVRYWTSIAGAPDFSGRGLNEAADMFQCFDQDNSGEIDRDEFLVLLNNMFPDRCQENEKHISDEFGVADANNTEGISFNEFLAYYSRLNDFYGRSAGWPPHDDELRKETLEKDFVTCMCGKEFLPDRLAMHQRSCPMVREKLAREREAAEADAAARRKADDDRRRAEDDRRRAEEAAARRRAEEEEERRRRAEEDAAAAAAAAAAARAAKKAAAADANGLKMCRHCNRTFFPDRLAVHERICGDKLGIHGIRPTMTPGESKATIGRYEIPAGW